MSKPEAQKVSTGLMTQEYTFKKGEDEEAKIKECKKILTDRYARIYQDHCCGVKASKLMYFPVSEEVQGKIDRHEYEGGGCIGVFTALLDHRAAKVGDFVATEAMASGPDLSIFSRVGDMLFFLAYAVIHGIDETYSFNVLQRLE